MCFILLHVTTRYLSVMGNAFILFIYLFKTRSFARFVEFLICIAQSNENEKPCGQNRSTFRDFHCNFFFHSFQLNGSPHSLSLCVALIYLDRCDGIKSSASLFLSPAKMCWVWRAAAESGRTRWTVSVSDDRKRLSFSLFLSPPPPFFFVSSVSEIYTVSCSCRGGRNAGTAVARISLRKRVFSFFLKAFETDMGRAFGSCTKREQNMEEERSPLLILWVFFGRGHQVKIYECLPHTHKFTWRTKKKKKKGNENRKIE